MGMKRHIELDLLNWKNSPTRKPLIFRGARQTGKTYTIKKFGNENYKNFVVADFEKRPELNEIFSGTLDPREIVQQLERIFGSRIQSPDTLLFFDEIQRCPRAIMALRYFKEEWPELSVIAAGSLLELAMSEISVPVGRVTYLHMFPLSFAEFLVALNETLLAEYLEKNWGPTDDVIHKKLLGLVRKYACIGGMPEAVNRYVSTGSLLEACQVHAEIIESFRDDFSKYGKKIPVQYLQKVMSQIPRFVGQQIKYVKLDQETRSRDIKLALEFLEKAKIAHRVLATSAAGLPLGASAADATFKAIFLDIGLMQTLCGVNWNMIPDKEDFLSINQGALAEQFVGQEILASQPCNKNEELYYWKREGKNAQAEVDFLLAYQGGVAPVEVKNASSGRLRSLHLLRDQYHPTHSFVVSSHPYAQCDGITWIPLYNIRRWIRADLF